jgi:predicted phosphodiesterase
MPTVAVLADLHANLSAVEAVAADLARRGVRRAAVLGDLVGYLTRPNQTVARVRALGWQCLAGNYDLAVCAGGEEGARRYLKPGIGPVPREVYAWTCRRVRESTRRRLAALPERLELEEAGRRVLAVHGSPEGVRDYVYPDRPEADLARWLARAGAGVLAMGHTHLPMVRRLSAGLAVNPGSVGKPKDGDPRASYALLHLPSRPREEPWAEIVRVDYDLETEAALLEQAGLPPETVRRLRQGR